VVDVVPFVPLGVGRGAAEAADMMRAVSARDEFARWASAELGLPCFLYGPRPGGDRSLPEVRRGAFRTLHPDAGPPVPHPTAGAVAVGARGLLVAYNLWIGGGDATVARSVAAAVRSPAVRALGFDLDGGVQVSCNLVEPLRVGPAQVHDAVEALLEATGAGVTRCELVGLLPEAVLVQVPSRRWSELGLDPGATIEARLGEQVVS
jgi:glutamate formiminotransferase / 5-formyltetrahydrofolate cyclo-ligase